MIDRFAAIFWKEWKSIQPFFFLTVVLFITGLFWVQFTEFMDEESIWELIFENGALVLTFVLCLIASQGTLTREKDDGSLLYLDALPVTRASVYTVKWLVAFYIIAGLNTFLVIEFIVYELLSRESNMPDTPWRHIAIYWLLNIFATAFFLSILFPLSFLRSWIWLVMGGLFYGLNVLEFQSFPYTDLINPFELIQPPLDVEDDWGFPWKQVVVLSIIGFGGWLIGLAVFANRGFSRRKSRGGFNHPIWAKFAMLLGTVILVVAWVGHFLRLDPIEGEVAASKLESIDSKGVQRVSTDDFEFVYREQVGARLRPLADQADVIFNQVVDCLQAKDIQNSDRIVVDMTNPLGSHNAGQAYWNKIRMGLPVDQDLSDSMAILGHEVCHVVIDRVTNGRLEDNFNSARWFHEGLASYIEFKLFRNTKERKLNDHWLALSSSWGEVKFSELVLDNLLNSKRDSFVVYAAGKEWIHALVDIYGDEAPAKLLRSLGRADAPPKLRGIELWRDACLAVNYDLERIRARFRQRLSMLRERYRLDCDKLPEVKEVTIQLKEGMIIVTPVLPVEWRVKAPVKARLICRLRPDSDSPPYQWAYSKFDRESQTFSTSALLFQKAKVGVQIGWLYPEWLEQPVFGEWIEKNVR